MKLPEAPPRLAADDLVQHLDDALFALASPHGWIALAMPVLMLHFLINVTGLKATEEQALRTKGERYRLYQARTSGFLPWFPKRIEQQ